MRWLLRFSILVLVATGSLAAAPVPAVSTLDLEPVLRQVEALLADGARDQQAVTAAVLRLRRLAADHDRRPPGDLLRHLAVRLAPLAGGGEEISEDRRRQLLDFTGCSLRMLRQKMAPPPGESRAGAGSATPPAHDACAMAAPLADGTLDGSTSGATPDGVASCGGTAPSPDVWYSYIAAADGLVVWHTAGSSLDTVLSLHSACPDAGGAHELSCSDDSRGDLSSLLARDMSAGETVLVRVSGAGGASGSFRLTTDPDGGGIAGRVTKEASGEPLAEAWVTLHSVFGHSVDAVPAEADGRYVFGGVNPGQWFVRAFEPSLLGEVWNDVPCPSFCDVEDVGDVVTVDSGLTDGIDFALAAGGSVTGTMRDGVTGDGIPFADIAAYDAAGVLFSSGPTDSLGGYLVPGLAAGSYTLRTFTNIHYDELYDDIGCGTSCDVLAGTPVEVAAGSTTEGIDFDLLRRGSISGRITRSYDGAPLSNGFLTVFDAEGRVEKFSGVGFDGRYVVDQLQPGEHFVLLEDDGYVDELYDDVLCGIGCDLMDGTLVPVAPATETAGVDFVLDLESLVTGRVTDDVTGEPLPADLRVYDQHGFIREARFNDSNTGVFEVLGLDPGSYFLVASAFGSQHEDQLYRDRGCNPSCSVLGGEPVVVTSGGVTTGIDFELLRCVHPSNRHLGGTIGTERTFEACRTIRVDTLIVTENGLLSLRAGRSVVFGDGFRVEAGGRLEVAIGTTSGSE